ncbi:MAG: DNA-processing protein DprA [Bacteroidetes bacterium]|nr:DNA-processing protein DprA [Bacteroidota bacterium]
MNDKDLQLQQIALQYLQGIGSIKARKLVNACECVSDIFTLSLLELSKRTGISKTILKSMQRDQAIATAKDHLKNIQRLGYQQHFITDSAYPRRLKNCDDAPMVLYSDGEMDLNTQKMVAIVGTRKATTYGKKTCDILLDFLKSENVVVISGMAYGIDIHVHQLCLQHQIPTIGVLGHGLDRMYPNLHRSTGLKMKQNGGLLTEFVPFTNPDKENFPKRNRIVAGMSDATIVIESKIRGGSLITAQLANDYNREVFAVPGNLDQPTSEGCNSLIARQLAHLYQGPEQFLKIMNWSKDATSALQYQIQWDILSEPQAEVCKLLKEDGPIHLDHLSTKTHFNSGQLGLILFELEMQGMIRSLPGMMYTLTA